MEPKVHEIKKQIACIFIFVMMITIGACLLINHLFLEKIYTQHKKNVILSAYDNLNKATQDDSVTSEYLDVELRKISEKYNISVLIIGEKSNTVKIAGSDADVLLKELYNNMFNNKLQNQEKIIVTNQYELVLSYDSAMGTEYLEMWGVLDNGNIFFIRSPIEGVRDSAQIANRFLVYVGLLVTFISALFIWLFVTRITKPIRELTEISTKMIDLDFETKYCGKANNEVDLLGNNMNLLSDTLEKTISELKTANIELKKDIEKKEQIDEMRKDFLSNVSHELKTPLALIQGYAEGLKEGVSNSEESRNYYCEVIMDEAEKMNSMVKKLLDLNALEFGNDVVTMERFDITAMIRNFVQSAEYLVKQNGIHVILEEHAPIYVWADEFKTEEVFRNYFSNAMNYAKGEKKIEIRYKVYDKKVRINVFNTGDRIPQEALPRVWEKFYKVDKARTREYGGSGVGLSIVKAIMDAMNQQYGVNNYQDGVEFWFELETK